MTQNLLYGIVNYRTLLGSHPFKTPASCMCYANYTKIKQDFAVNFS